MKKDMWRSGEEMRKEDLRGHRRKEGGEKAAGGQMMQGDGR